MQNGDDITAFVQRESVLLLEQKVLVNMNKIAFQEMFS